MIRPEDLTNRVVVHAPTERVIAPSEDETPETESGEPCPPSQPAPLEHGERTGGCPDPGNA